MRGLKRRKTSDTPEPGVVMPDRPSNPARSRVPLLQNWNSISQPADFSED